MWKALSGVAVAVLAAVAGCQNVCNCPANGCNNCSASSSATGAVPLSSDAGAVASVAADSPCSATLEPTYGTAGRVLVSRLGPGTCTVRVVFASGATEVSHVQFTVMMTDCGCYIGAYPSPLEPVDAGNP